MVGDGSTGEIVSPVESVGAGPTGPGCVFGCTDVFAGGFTGSTGLTGEGAIDADVVPVAVVDELGLVSDGVLLSDPQPATKHANKPLAMD